MLQIQVMNVVLCQFLTICYGYHLQIQLGLVTDYLKVWTCMHLQGGSVLVKYHFTELSPDQV